MAQVLFFDIFSEKDPHLNAVQKAIWYDLSTLFFLHLFRARVQKL